MYTDKLNRLWIKTGGDINTVELTCISGGAGNLGKKQTISIGCYVDMLIEQKQKGETMKSENTLALGIAHIVLAVIAMIALLTSGCAETGGVVKVCVNYLEPEAYCGTGTFVGPDTMLMSHHVAERAEGGVVEVVMPGFNELSSSWERLPDRDLVIVRFDSDVTDDYAVICDKPKLGNGVEIAAVISWNGSGYETKTGHITKYDRYTIYAEGTAPQGYSGGPMVDIEKDRDCLIGIVKGLSIASTNLVVAENITELEF